VLLIIIWKTHVFWWGTPVVPQFSSLVCPWFIDFHFHFFPLPHPNFLDRYRLCCMVHVSYHTKTTETGPYFVASYSLCAISMGHHFSLHLPDRSSPTAQLTGREWNHSPLRPLLALATFSPLPPHHIQFPHSRATAQHLPIR